MIEKANLESLEVMRCQVEEKARAEAMLIAKLEEEAAAAKLAIDRAKTEKEGLLSKIASGLSSRSLQIVGKSADIRKKEEGRWETLHKQGHASVKRNSSKCDSGLIIEIADEFNFSNEHALGGLSKQAKAKAKQASKSEETKGQNVNETIERKQG